MIVKFKKTLSAAKKVALRVEKNVLALASGVVAQLYEYIESQ